MEVKILNKSRFDAPQYATIHSAGMDLRANIEESITISPLERVLIPTGFTLNFPKVMRLKSVREADLPQSTV